MSSAETIQRTYYTNTASDYDMLHSEEAEHKIALQYISTFIELAGISSILDVGCGTGRGARYFSSQGSNVQVFGIEPIQSLLDQAVQYNGIQRESLIRGSGYALPFKDCSFDAVCEFAVLHHVSNPSAVVKEMIRVARRAVFISDCNRFGQGKPFSRILKLIFYKIGGWNIVDFIKTRGKHYHISKGDGLFYSYSVFDSYHILADWADRIILIPTGNEKSKNWLHPLLTSGQILVAALKERVPVIR